MTKTVNDLLNELEELCKMVREIHGDDTVCGYCEYDAGYIGEGPVECPGFESNECFVLKNHFVKSMKLGRVRRNKQMRFIDADKLIEKITQNCPFKIDTNYESVWGIPIIEAITIEWIKKYKRVRGWEVTVTTQNAIDNMLNAWEKENEK